MPEKEASSVDDYLSRVPVESRVALELLRETIKSAAPMAEETISYKIPTFNYKGSLVAFAAFKNHLSFFVMSPAVMEAHSDELTGYKTGEATLHFTADEPLPGKLVEKLVKARIEENEARKKD
ncbi:MAG: DUF1801 domain-containing protein [Actinobacteria bacterium]|nr:DUF1801 domain-containing protein [Actinomycetota bacterium]